MEAYTLAQLTRRAMRQTGLSEEDMEDFGQELRWYLNEGYSILVREAYRPWHEEQLRAKRGKIWFDRMRYKPVRVLCAWEGGMPVSARIDRRKRCVRLAIQEERAQVRIRYTYTPRPMEEGGDMPDLPDWAHGAIADYATWRFYMQGNPQRQQRGLAFRQAFEEVKRRLRPLEEQRLGWDKFRGLYMDR